MADEIRVRTQAERDADGQAWRAAAYSRPGYATYPETKPGNPSWLLRANPTLRIPVNPEVLAHAVDGLPPVDGETCKQWCGFCHVGTGVPAPTPAPPPFPGEPVPAEPLADAAAAVSRVLREHLPAIREALTELTVPPRRRWWHRYTRPGRKD